MKIKIHTPPSSSYIHHTYYTYNMYVFFILSNYIRESVKKKGKKKVNINIQK